MAINISAKTDYSMLFSSLSTNSNNPTNSIFGGSSGASSSFSLSDYAMIKNGSYGKLMKAYYGTNTPSTSTAGKQETEETKAEKLALSQAKTEATGLAKASSALRNHKLYEMKKDKETGELGYDMDGIAKNVKSFVEAYNKTLDTAAEVDTQSVLKKTLWMISDTKAQDDLLSDIGITIGSDNKLTLNEETLKEADMSKIKTLFAGYGSYADKIYSKASQINNLAYATMRKGVTSASLYTNTADYNTLTTESIYNSMF